MNSKLWPITPTIRFRVGVSGHRTPPKLPRESEPPIRSQVELILATVIETARRMEDDYKRNLPSRPAAPDAAAALASKFVIVSSVAEGSDRIVAEIGLASGFALEIVLPFGRDEYAHDFETDPSKANYQRLLAQAAAVFELDGDAAARSRAYETAGFVMLANIDLLIAIWDGEEAAGIGGTEQIIGRAVASGIPVVWIEPSNPNAMKLSWPRPGEVRPENQRPKETFRIADPADLAKAIEEIVALPRQPETLESLKSYLREKERRWNFCPWYSLLLWLYAVRPIRWSDFHFARALDDSRAQWQKYLAISRPTGRNGRQSIKSCCPLSPLRITAPSTIRTSIAAVTSSIFCLPLSQWRWRLLVSSFTSRKSKADWSVSSSWSSLLLSLPGGAANEDNGTSVGWITGDWRNAFVTFAFSRRSARRVRSTVRAALSTQIKMIGSTGMPGHCGGSCRYRIGPLTPNTLRQCAMPYALRKLKAKSTITKATPSEWPS